MQEQIYQWHGEVRDNETDLQGIVNNANYFIYMAHARHKHLKSLGIDFFELSKSGFNLVLVNTNIAFKASLKSGDLFVVTSKFLPKGKIRIVCPQQIIRQSDDKIVTIAENIISCVNVKTERPEFPEQLKNFFNL